MCFVLRKDEKNQIITTNAWLQMVSIMNNNWHCGIDLCSENLSVCPHPLQDQLHGKIPDAVSVLW